MYESCYIFPLRDIHWDTPHVHVQRRRSGSEYNGVHIAISCCSWQQFYCIIDVVNYTYENNFDLACNYFRSMRNSTNGRFVNISGYN